MLQNQNPSLSVVSESLSQERGAKNYYFYRYLLVMCCLHTHNCVAQSFGAKLVGSTFSTPPVWISRASMARPYIPIYPEASCNQHMT